MTKTGRMASLMPPPPDPLDDRERRALGLSLLALGRYGQLARLEAEFAAGGVRALRGLDPSAEELFDSLYWSPEDELPDPAGLSPDDRAALAERRRESLAVRSLGRG